MRRLGLFLNAQLYQEFLQDQIHAEPVNTIISPLVLGLEY